MPDPAPQPGPSPSSLVTDPTSVLPRAALLAVWGTAALTGRASADQARAAIEASDEPHTVCGIEAPTHLGDWLAALRQDGVTGLRLILPEPGRAQGLPGPAQVNAAALAAGECVATINGQSWLAYPVVTRFGSSLEPGALVEWAVRDSAGPARADFVDARQANRELREGLLRSTAQLEELELATWHPAARSRSKANSPSDATALLPAGSTPQAIELLALGWRVAQILDAATDAAGGLNGWQVDQRGQSLANLRVLARTAIVAAINDPLCQQL